MIDGMTIRRTTTHGRRPKEADDRWLDGGAVFTAKRWTVVVMPTTTEWTDTAGMDWRAVVAVEAASMRPGVVTFSASAGGGRTDLGSVDLGSVEMSTIAMSASIGFGSPGVDIPFMPMPATCAVEGKDWRYYVRTVLAGDEVEAEAIPRRNATDYEAVAVEYLAAVDAGEDPVGRIMRRMDCSSRVAARKWVQRAGDAGWLTSARRGSGARRGAGPRMLSERR